MIRYSNDRWVLDRWVLMLMGSKFLIKMTRPQNIALNVLQPGHLYQKF